MQEVLHLAAQRLDELLRARQGEADHVDDDVGLEGLDRRAKAAGLLGRIAIDGDAAHRLPRGIFGIGRALAAADVDHFVPGLDEPRHQIGADMPAATNDYYARHIALPCPLRHRSSPPT